MTGNVRFDSARLAEISSTSRVGAEILATLARGRAHLVALLLAIGALTAVDARGAFQWVDNALVAARMRAAPVAARGDVVFVAIDARSLRAVGVWPWPRQVYAATIRALLAAGAREIFLDVDLSARSTPEADAELARALGEAGGSVVLPVFRQDGSVGENGSATNLPLPEFSDPAWLATVNVRADPDGVVRRYPYGVIIDTEAIPSAASLLSGVFDPAGSEFLINFALDPGTVPTASLIDVLEGRPTIELDGKSVVIGAHALEIRDSFAVPVHSVLPGAMIQILATETLAQDIALRSFNRQVPIALVSAIALLLVSRSRARMAATPLGLMVLGILVETMAFWAQTRHSLVISTPVLMAILLATQVVVAGRELDVRRWLVQLARVERTNIERILERVIADSLDAVLLVDDRLRVLRISRSARALFEVPESVGRGAELAAIVPSPMVDMVREVLLQSAAGAPQTSRKQDLTIERGGGSTHIEFAVAPSRLWRLAGRDSAAEGEMVACLTARDVTADREQRQRIDRLARFDVLTGAPNRNEFTDRLTQRITGGAQDCAVIAFNLHRLQTINATLGREVGDALLAAVVARIDGAGLAISPLSRLGGDRFAAFTVAPATAAMADYVGHRIARLIEAPFRLGAQTVRIGLRVGVALGAEGDDGEQLLGKAELALDEARMREGSGLRTFDEAAFVRQERARQIERAHWSALTEGQMHLAYQPQVSLTDGSIVGAEALVRWTHPQMGAISPGEFIEIAEGSGFIEHLGRWVLEVACLDAMEWPGEPRVSVNVSPAQFHRSDVVADVERALAISGLRAQRLCLEITESVFFGGAAGFAGIFSDLRRLGVSLALDDFGSGYSSFGHLARLPLDKLKVDQMFVRGLGIDSFNEAVIRSILSLSRELGLKVVYEGVETAVQSERLMALGGDEAQGYFYGFPKHHAAFLERLRGARRIRRQTGS